MSYKLRHISSVTPAQAGVQNLEMTTNKRYSNGKVNRFIKGFLGQVISRSTAPRNRQQTIEQLENDYAINLLSGQHSTTWRQQ